ncbi:MAG: OmpH family outer membrane protein [Candidatus Omnitrophica bacterium]|nr:OmpH family outer membrane protein [Candidatus Omnitrophota bacterium]
MKGNSKIIVILVFATFILSIFALQEAFAAGKIAYVDLASVFDGYKKTKDYDVKLENIQNERQKEIDKRVNAIKEMQDKLPLLSEKEKEEKQKQIDDNTRELQEFQRNAEMDLREERDEKLKEVLQDIQDVVETLAKQNGYDLIFNNRVLLYGNDSLDISKVVLKKLNGNYKKK